MNDVEYFLLTSQDHPTSPTEQCALNDFRRCGNLSISVPTLLDSLSLILRHVGLDGNDRHTLLPPTLDALKWDDSTVRSTWSVRGAVASRQCSQASCCIMQWIST